MSEEILVPQNVEAEACVLGSLLIDPEALPMVSDFLSPDDFYRDAHRTIYQAYLDLWEEGVAADLVLLTDELSRRGKLDEVGGVAYVSSLGNQVPTSANIEHYGHIVERTAILRRLIGVAGKIAAIAYSEPDADVAVTEATRLISEVHPRVARRQGAWIEEAIDTYLDETLANMERGEAIGVRTGDSRIDDHCFGFLPGELIYIAGRPGSGKSTLAASWALEIAASCARRGGPGMVEWITLEMTATQQAKRLLSSLATVDGRLMRAGFRNSEGMIAASAYQRVKHAADEAKEFLAKRIHFTDQPIKISGIRDLLARRVYEHGCVAAFVDYLGLVEAENARQDMYQRMTDASQKLKQIALELNIPIFCLLQMNRQAESRQNKRPMLADLRDSGSLEQDGDWVFGIYRPAYYYPRTAERDASQGGHFRQLMELIVLKAREGVGGNVTIPLQFEGEYTRVSHWPEAWDWEQYARMTGSDDASEGGAA